MGGGLGGIVTATLPTSPSDRNFAVFPGGNGSGQFQSQTPAANGGSIGGQGANKVRGRTASELTLCRAQEVELAQPASH